MKFKFKIVLLSLFLSILLYLELTTPNLYQQELTVVQNDVNAKNLTEFFRVKEAIYQARRERIQHYCAQQPSNFSRLVYSMLHDSDNGISMCPIAKVASTTWLQHFARIGNMLLIPCLVNNITPGALQDGKMAVRGQMRKGLRGGRKLSNEDNLSIVVVRHPFSRLASGYYNKFVEHSWGEVRWNRLSSIQCFKQ